MSQLPPPPPTPGPAAGFDLGSQSPGHAPGNAQAPRARPLPGQVPALTTNFSPPLGTVPATPTSAALLSPSTAHIATPATAIPARTPTGLVFPSHIASPRTAVNAVMEPYNPRQWSQASGTQMGVQRRTSPVPRAPATTQGSGMEAVMPSPPPPYSPNSNDNSAQRDSIASPLLGNIGFTASPRAERSSPPPMSPAFPPPPSSSSRSRERSLPGMAGQKSFFSLSNLRGKLPANRDIQDIPPPSTPILPFHSMEVRPPAARRAASAGHVESSASSSSIGPSSPDGQWQPGMPLPGPPPGPPPAGARSQSLDRPIGRQTSNGAGPSSGNQAFRRRTMAPSDLGPVPPTPADFIENGPETFNIRKDTDNTAYRPLHIDTGNKRDSHLARRPAKRDTSTGIRERRSRSRAARTSENVPEAEDSPQTDSLVNDPSVGSINRRREHTRKASERVESIAGPTPGSSAQDSGQPKSAKQAVENVLTPPYTPAPGNPAVPLGSASSDRPMSQMLYTPNEDNPSSLSPVRPYSSASQRTGVKLDAFALKAIERHRAFIEKEATAVTDEERLQLFATFIVHESRLRRDQYTGAYNAMAGEIVDLTRDMWRSYAGSSKRVATPSTSMSSVDPTVPSWASDGQPTSANPVPSSASSFGDFPLSSDGGPSGDAADASERADARQWADAFKPSLSPIPSMAVSTVPDENSSRGRTASRWWEHSNSGSDSIGRPDRIEKSRRETKYMGVIPAALQAISDEAMNSGQQQQPTPEASQQSFSYGPNEYPPEKVGWHEGTEYDTPLATPQRDERKHSTSTPGTAPMDVSRLVTLPPSYPRHHPAVNKSHPELAELRAVHRLINDHTEVQKIKNTYFELNSATTQEQLEASQQRRSKFRSDIQHSISYGTMSYADAAQAEADFDAEEAERGKTTARANFDAFETHLSHPLNALLTDRLTKADTRIGELREDLESGDASSDPNHTQEEGDEHPERLEKLNLLKWLFEAREQIHKEMFEFHTMRSEKYAEVILTPYRIAKLQNKLDEAMTFFKKDNAERGATYAKEAQTRFDELQTTIERNVARGVQDQLSAFWDIAPGLLEVIQQIPANVAGLQIDIPLQEYEENPSYHDHPLQYLYSVLGHAEKSTYQFIEAQINLLCLLHEVRTAATKARLRLLEIERHAASPNDSSLRTEMDMARQDAEDRLTQDLKEKVGEVERQWNEALGDGIKECKGRVRHWLEESGGLEDGLDG